MKKTIIILLVLCLLGGAAAGFLLGRSGGAAPSAYPGQGEPAADEQAVADDGEQAGRAAPRMLDLEKLYNSRDPDEVVASVAGQELSWKEYFYFLMSQASQVEDYFLQMATYYNLVMDWADPVDESGQTFAQMTLDGAESSILQVAAIRGFAAENGVGLSEEDRAALAAQLESDIVTACGEGATEEDFNEYIASIYLPRELYDSMNEMNYLYQNSFLQLYGETGEKLDEETAMSYLTENGYMAATHILLMNMDPATREELDEQALADKQAQAEAIAAELQAIEDPQERLARFNELKEELCEDSGKSHYPDGYIFLPGEMVPEFEEATLSLEEYQVSDVVASSYGWHVIMRLPLDVDGVIEYSSAGSPMSARSLAANEEYGELLQAYYDGLSVEYAGSFSRPDLLEYLTEE